MKILLTYPTESCKFAWWPCCCPAEIYLLQGAVWGLMSSLSAWPKISGGYTIVKMLPSQSPTFLLSFQMGHTWSGGWKQSNFFLLLLSINFLQIILVLCMLSGRHKLREDVLGVVKNIVNKMRIWDKFTHSLSIIYTIYISEVSRVEYMENHVYPVIRCFLILPW